MTTQAPKRWTRNAAEKRSRIIAAAQRLFTQHGYSQTSIKQIATLAGVSMGLVNAHFDSKLKLFEAALVNAFDQTSSGLSEKAGFADRLSGVVLNNPVGVASPAMIILSIEDEEARKVAVAVLREHGIGPTEAWLDGEQARDRALYINFLGLCLSLMGRLFADEIQLNSVPMQWLLGSVQQAVDGDTPRS